MFRFMHTEGFHQYEDYVITGKIKENPEWLNVNAVGGNAFYAPSVRSALEHIDRHMPPAQARESVRYASYGDDFNKFQTWDEMMDVFKHKAHTLIPDDWIENRLQLRETAGNDVFYDITGDYVDVGRYMIGEPEHFGNQSMGNPMGIFADIIVNVGAVCFMSEQTINTRARRVLRLVDWLESQKIRCQITSFEVTQISHIEVTVKALGEGLDLAALAVGSHSEWLRRVVFRINEQSDRWDYGYGQVCNTKTQNMKKQDFSDSNGIVIVSELGYNDKPDTVNAAFDKLENELADDILMGERRKTYYV